MHSKEDHDRFCPCAQTEQECDLISVETDRCVSCECPRIALVRADEREKAAQRVERGVLGIDGIIFGCPFCGDPWESEPSCEHWPVIERLAAAVRGES